MTDTTTVETGTVALLNKGEIDMQIATAHKYPRSIKRFRDEALAMVTLNEAVAQECMYSLPRDGKTIEGPSARFAEVVASAWGNSRAGARVVNEDGAFVTAQGVFHDLERNVAITYEVQRRITGRNGRRYSADMIGVTANAACSIALRNAILKGVPKAFWSDLYDAARETAIGNVQTLANRRARALATLQKYGVVPTQVFALLEIDGEDDITVDHLGTLFGIMTALKEGETTVEQAFPVASGRGAAPQTMPQAEFDKSLDGWAKHVASGKLTLDALLGKVQTKGVLTDEQKASLQKAIEELKKKDGVTDVELKVTYAQVAEQIHGAGNLDALNTVADLIGSISDETQRAELAAIYDKRVQEMEGVAA